MTLKKSFPCLKCSVHKIGAFVSKNSGICVSLPGVLFSFIGGMKVKRRAGKTWQVLQYLFY